ncbi:hypothetical protein [Metabacillus sediminilitoris]|uniref:Uncharacterized protein n=1 Tax=Metabacillus sediminilitoris TaxID=2567941 RepID=A0A4S4C1G1_9BACI|nr:hypothetical protein [Metabacillus sediminilitoris]QGQ46329.1 hypothetical protein GMB29_14545 [Metabacillus sediminilitoris]THF79378.1 hypothetical protein E6W99_13645 [Metabacillus sediminilitoris]
MTMLTEAEGKIINKVVQRKLNQVILSNNWKVAKVKGKWNGGHWKAQEVESYLMEKATVRAIRFINRPENERTTELENWLNRGMEWIVKDFYKHMKTQDVLNLGDSYTEKLSVKRASMDNKVKGNGNQDNNLTLHEMVGNDNSQKTDKVTTDNTIIELVDEVLMLLEDKVSVNKYEKFTIVLEGIAFADKWTMKDDKLVKTGSVKDNGTIHLEGLGEELGMHPSTITRLLKEIAKLLENDKKSLRKFAKTVRF